MSPAPPKEISLAVSRLRAQPVVLESIVGLRRALASVPEVMLVALRAVRAVPTPENDGAVTKPARLIVTLAVVVRLSSVAAKVSTPDAAMIRQILLSAAWSVSSRRNSGV